MTGQEKIPSSVRKAALGAREVRLAEALRENLRRRKAAQRRDQTQSEQDGAGDEGPLDDRD